MLKLKNFEIRNPEESLGMGGPYLGDLYFNNIKFNGKFFPKIVASENSDYILFSKYYTPKGSFFKKVRDFRILVYDVKQNIFHEQNSTQQSLIISSFKNNILTYHEAFHDGLEKLSESITFNSDNFSIINIEQLKS